MSLDIVRRFVNGSWKTEAAETGGGDSLPAQWTVDADGNLLIQSSGFGNFGGLVPSQISGIAIKVDAGGSDVFWVDHPILGDGIFQLSVDGGIVGTQVVLSGLAGSNTLRAIAGDASGVWLFSLSDGNGGRPIVVQNDGKLGFFAATPIDQPTGVAVTAAGIHAALVSLGLITG